MWAFTSKRLRLSFTASADNSGSTASDTALLAASAAGKAAAAVALAGEDGSAEGSLAEEAVVAAAEFVLSASF